MTLLHRLQAFTIPSHGSSRIHDMGRLLNDVYRRASSAHASPVQLLQTNFDFGQSLHLHLQSPTSIQVKHGSPYTLQVEVPNCSELNRFKTVKRGSEWTVEEQVQSNDAVNIAAQIPERYCGVRVSSQGGPISMSGVSEAWVDGSTTSTGSISAGKCKGHSVSLATEDGDITGSLTALDMAVRTRSGSIDLKRVAGGTARVTIAEGSKHSHLQLGVLQCVSAYIDSGGSDVAIKQIAAVPDLQAPGRLEVDTDGMLVKAGEGNITISGVDGPARLESTGGEIAVQVLRCVDLEAVSKGGVIRVQLEPAQRYKVHARSQHGVHLGEGCVPAEGALHAEAREFHGYIACEGESHMPTGQSCSMTGSSADPILLFTADKVHIERKSWRDSVRDRLLNKG
eukprot:jgi/Ulvmu1/11847/UM081_0005.1